MKRSGFSLIEVLVAIAMIGLAIVSLVAANAVFTQNNSTALDVSTAEYLIEQIRELTMLLPVVDPQMHTFFDVKEGSVAMYDDVDDFDDAQFCPPINADRQGLSAFAGFTQKVTVQKVSSSNFEQVIDDNPTPPSPDSPFIRVKVDIYRHGIVLLSSSWIRANY